VNFAWALANNGRAAEAFAQFEQVRRLQPDLADAEIKWGLSLAMHGDPHRGGVSHETGGRLQPENPDMRDSLGRALLAWGSARMRSSSSRKPCASTRIMPARVKY